MPRYRRTARWHPALLVLTCALLAACASRPQRSARRDLRLVDTETSARVHHAAAVTEGATPLASAATQTVASTLGKYVPALLALLRAALTLDFKFPCPGTNDPQWTRYGGNSAYADYNQGQIYKKALGGEALIISPRVG